MRGASGRRPRGWLRLLRLWPAALAAWTGFAPAQSITVSPLRADLSAATQVAVVTVRNDDPKVPTLVQARPSAWAVVDSADKYDPTRDLVVSPTVFRLEPGQTQVVRLSLRGKPDARSERLYRLFLQQLPDEAERSRQSGNVRFLFTFGIPVVVAPSDNAGAAPRIVWRVEPDAAGGYRLRARNDGTAHLKIATVALSGPGGETPVVGSHAYLLPGTERLWAFKPSAPLAPGPVSLTVVADDGTSSVVQASPAE